MSSGKLGPVIAILEHVPERWYGGKAKLARHSVLVALAKYANQDGRNIWASEARIAHTARVSTRTASDAMAYWEETGRIKQRGVHPIYGTKVYDLVLPTAEEAEEAKRERSEALEKDRTKTRERVARFREKAENKASKAACNGNSRVTDGQDVTADRASCNGNSRVTVTADRAKCNAASAVDLSSDLSLDLTKKRYDSAALTAAQTAYRFFCNEFLEEEETAFSTLLWVLYRAAAAKQIPQNAAYYKTSYENFWDEEYGQSYKLDAAEDRFRKHAARFVQANCPDLMAWLHKKWAELRASQGQPVSERATA